MKSLILRWSVAVLLGSAWGWMMSPTPRTPPRDPSLHFTNAKQAGPGRARLRPVPRGAVCRRLGACLPRRGRRRRGPRGGRQGAQLLASDGLLRDQDARGRQQHRLARAQQLGDALDLLVDDAANLDVDLARVSSL